MTDQTPQTTTEPVAWLMEDLILPSENITRDGVFAQRMAEYLYEGKPTYKVTPLYTTPQPLAIGLDREALERLNESAGYAERYQCKCAIVDTPDLRSLLALAAPAEGYVLVPVEPTREMWAAGGDAVVGYKQRHHDKVVEEIWSAMIAACLPAAPVAPADGWQGIETAPKDGTHFLAYEDTGDIFRAAYHREGYLMCWGSQPVVQTPEPTHWMPLPAAPTGETGA